MNEQLIVKNFGPIKDATVDFKKVTVFIGPTGGGKSTLAKLAAVFRDEYWIEENNHELKQTKFNTLLNDFQILDFLESNGSVIWLSSEDNSKYDSFGLKHDDSKRKELFKAGHEVFERIANRMTIPEPELVFARATEQERSIMASMYGTTIEPCYIPADRSFVAAIDIGLAGLTLKDIALPEALLKFLNDFNKAQLSLKLLPLDIPFLNVSYRDIENQARLVINNKQSIMLRSSASGMQSTIPMMLVINYLTKRRSKQILPYSFIIEEPELNLYPIAQYELLKWMTNNCLKSENDLIITTHSPYILASCNLLMEAYKVWQQRPELEAEIDKIVPRASWINPDDFAAYYVDKEVRSIKDERTDLIGGNDLDAVSGSISDAFRSLLRLKKQPA